MSKFKFPKKVLIIAEAGVNHNGNIDLAFKLIKTAKKCGADIVKFQLFKADKLIIKKANKPKYISDNKKLNKKTQFQILKELELSIEQMKKLSNYCKKVNIEFMLSPFDIDCILDIQKLNLKKIKIPSGEINNLPYLREVAKQKKDVIMSTGMSTLEEVSTSIKILEASGLSRKKITILHCTTDYPTKLKDVNLSAMNLMREKLNVKVGYSDHTNGNDVAIAATALGACVIEKHFTTDKSLPGPDHKASLEPKEFLNMVQSIRNVSLIYGNNKKIPVMAEKNNIKLVRKSIVANTHIKKHEAFNHQNIAIKRPGTGISPLEWDKVIGKKAKKNYKPDEIIKR
tara:strand:+ start:2065 stop:3090 length:1026 start_codon:yes stop_codon:yes gene_type:complete